MEICWDETGMVDNVIVGGLLLRQENYSRWLQISWQLLSTVETLSFVASQDENRNHAQKSWENKTLSVKMNDPVVQCSTWCSLWEMRGTTDGGCSGDIRPRPLLTLRLWSLVTILSPHQWEPVVSMRRNYFTLLGFLSLIDESWGDVRDQEWSIHNSNNIVITDTLFIPHSQFSMFCFRLPIKEESLLLCRIVLWKHQTRS